MKKAVNHKRWYTVPVFFLLLPVFFVMHGVQENAGSVPAGAALVLLGVYLVAAVVSYAVSWVFFRDRYKAGLFSVLLMGFHFFFGSMHDALKYVFDEGFFSRYSFVLPLSLLLFIIAFIMLLRRKRPLYNTSLYLNLLFLVLICWDVFWLIRKRSAPPETVVTAPCKDCERPDIYLVILDEYTGNQALREQFGFDNKKFIEQLRSRGFYVADSSTSNYNYTPFSVASTLDMDYLQLKGTERVKPDMKHAFEVISNNEVTRVLKSYGYEFYNHSVFDMPGQPAPVEESFIPARTRLITSQTFLSRMYRDLGYHLGATFHLQTAIDAADYRELNNNNQLYALTWRFAEQKRAKPAFVYTHLMMPHYPYYFDSTGKAMDPRRVIPESNNANRADYVQYLQYTNNKILSLTDHILKSSDKPKVIILLGDHGFRHFRPPVDRKYHFMNLCAVYLPAGNREGMYNSISNVNVLRVVLNGLFKTQYPMLGDSTVYLRD